jgi:hypothetical protein
MKFEEDGKSLGTKQKSYHAVAEEFGEFGQVGGVAPVVVDGDSVLQVVNLMPPATWHCPR